MNEGGYQLKLPLNLETIIPEDDSVRLLSQFVEEMDLTDLYSTYKRINSVSPRTLLKLLICLCKNHPLGRYAQPNPSSRYPRLDPTLLKNELILQLMPEQRTRQLTDRYFGSIGLKFKNIMTTSSLPAIMELVAVGYGAAFIFETHLMHHTFSQPIDCYSFGEPRTVSDFVVAHRHGSYLPSYAHDFIDIARSLFNVSDSSSFTIDQ